MAYPERMVRQLIREGDRPKLVAHSNHNVKRFTEEQIKVMTNDYATIVGRGAFGEVYKGVLKDKSRVAVKKFIRNVKENFAKELIVHREINHKNVVRLIGYCIDGSAVVLVTEYIPKGNLSVILHQDNIPITLDARLKIAIQCAEALRYMHTEMYTKVIHGDIKPANILLDESFSAKLSDFGISRLVNTENTLYTKNVIGSIGYMDPLLALNGRVTPKNDVYSFGVVLLELITRKRATRDDEETSLVERFTQARAVGVREMFDVDIAIPSNMKTILQVAKLAGKCLGMEHVKRPEMSEVAANLRRLRDSLQQGQEGAAMFSWGRRMGWRRNAMARGGGAPRGRRLLVIKEGAKELRAVTMENQTQPDAAAPAPAPAQREPGLLSEKQREPGHPIRPRLPVVPAKTPSQERAPPSQKGRSINHNMGTVTLDKVLQPGNNSTVAPLDWEQRSAISLAVACDVASVHSAGPSSIHGRIYSCNVLLTGTHVSEHGLKARVVPGLGFNEVGGRVISREEDVYNFGILLLELLTDRVLDHTGTGRRGAELRERLCRVASDGGLTMVLTENLVGWGHRHDQEKSILLLLQLALDCCSQRAPVMSDIVQVIQEIRQSSSYVITYYHF